MLEVSYSIWNYIRRSGMMADIMDGEFWGAEVLALVFSYIMRGFGEYFPYIIPLVL